MLRALTSPNSELAIADGNKAFWTHADHRRYGFHNLHRLARYGLSFRARRVMPLIKRMDPSIAELKAVVHYTALPWFSAMVVTQGQDVLFERFAADFASDRPHSIQSITKTMINLIVGKLVGRGTLELSRTISEYIPEIGSGYANATVQQVLNMDVENEYTEDFTDPTSTYYLHEEAMGWRLPRNEEEENQHSFLSRIKSLDTTNHTGRIQYKDANTEVLAWVAERASGRPLRMHVADIVDAAGIEGALYITCDREGTPCLSGGASFSARDLTRYLSLFVRRGEGVDGQLVGSPEFIDQTLAAGIPLPKPYQRMRYSNHTRVIGRSIAHTGWGGQCAMANLDNGRIAVFLSVIENEHATNEKYLPGVIEMLESIVGS